MILLPGRGHGIAGAGFLVKADVVARPRGNGNLVYLGRLLTV